MYVKIVKRKFETKDGSVVRIYHYLAEKIRDGLKVKDNLIRKLTTSEVMAFVENKDSFLNDINSTNDSTDDSVSTLKLQLTDLINEINNKEEPFNKPYRPQKFSEIFLVPLLE